MVIISGCFPHAILQNVQQTPIWKDLSWKEQNQLKPLEKKLGALVLEKLFFNTGLHWEFCFTETWNQTPLATQVT